MSVVDAKTVAIQPLHVIWPRTLTHSSWPKPDALVALELAKRWTEDMNHVRDVAHALATGSSRATATTTATTPSTSTDIKIPMIDSHLPLEWILTIRRHLLCRGEFRYTAITHLLPMSGTMSDPEECIRVIKLRDSVYDLACELRRCATELPVDKQKSDVLNSHLVVEPYVYIRHIEKDVTTLILVELAGIRRAIYTYSETKTDDRLCIVCTIAPSTYACKRCKRSLYCSDTCRQIDKKRHAAGTTLNHQHAHKVAHVRTTPCSGSVLQSIYIRMLETLVASTMPIVFSWSSPPTTS